MWPRTLDDAASISRGPSRADPTADGYEGFPIVLAAAHLKHLAVVAMSGWATKTRGLRASASCRSARARSKSTSSRRYWFKGASTRRRRGLPTASCSSTASENSTLARIAIASRQLRALRAAARCDISLQRIATGVARARPARRIRDRGGREAAGPGHARACHDVAFCSRDAKPLLLASAVGTSDEYAAPSAKGRANTPEHGMREQRCLRRKTRVCQMNNRKAAVRSRTLGASYDVARSSKAAKLLERRRLAAGDRQRPSAIAPCVKMLATSGEAQALRQPRARRTSGGHGLRLMAAC